MIKTPTVFLTGAGASWHYGFPTGDTLVVDVAMRCRQLQLYIAHSVDCNNLQIPLFIKDSFGGDWQTAQLCVEIFAKRLSSADPIVIDYFLGLNPDLQVIGRLLIAWVILDAQAQSLLTRRNKNKPDTSYGTTQSTHNLPIDNWVRFIVHKLTSECRKSEDLLKNDVKFVTFNYDTSFEYFLRDGLNGNSLFQSEDINAFFEDRFVHVYGSVGEDGIEYTQFEDFDRKITQPSVSSTSGALKFIRIMLDKIYAKSKGLLVIDPDTKDNEACDAARNSIAASQVIYFLGYGFDPNNNDRIGLSQLHWSHPEPRLVYFTNFNNVQRVNKSVGHILLSDRRYFVDSDIRAEGANDAKSIEKSRRNVYDSLALDFE